MTLSNNQGHVLYDWWHDVTQQRDKGSDRAARAILRRAHDITEITLSQPYQHLFQRMREADWNDGYAQSNNALAAVAGLLVHLETHKGDKPLANCMGLCPSGSDRPYVSEVRFKRLLESPNLDTLFNGLRRALSLMQEGAPVLGLANDVLSWARPEQRDQVKKDWAYSYVWPKQPAH